jgi:hypothetical protein
VLVAALASWISYPLSGSGAGHGGIVTNETGIRPFELHGSIGSHSERPTERLTPSSPCDGVALPEYSPARKRTVATGPHGSTSDLYRRLSDFRAECPEVGGAIRLFPATNGPPVHLPKFPDSGPSHECSTIDAMAKWLTLEQGLKAAGLRIAPVSNGIPSPWSELCRALFRVKRIPFALIDARDPKRGLADLKAATGHETLPVLFSGSERPLASWLDQILFAERMTSAPRLLPSHPRDRAAIIGFLAELCAEDGFGWNRRLLMVERLLTEPRYGERERGIGHYLADKYGYSRVTNSTAQRRCEDIVAAFVERHSAGGRFLYGDTLTALDLGWAAFAALVQPLPEEVCPMNELWRDLYTWTPQQSSRESVGALLTHRERIYREWIGLPVDVR